MVRSVDFQIGVRALKRFSDTHRSNLSILRASARQLPRHGTLPGAFVTAAALVFPPCGVTAPCFSPWSPS